MTATWCRVIGKPISSKVGSSPAPAAEPTIIGAMAAIKNIFFMLISRWIRDIRTTTSKLTSVQFAGTPYEPEAQHLTHRHSAKQRTPCQVLGNLPDVEPSSIERRLNVVV